MHMLSPSLRRAPALAAALLVALVMSGCAFKNPFASKNPLIDEEPAPITVAQAEVASGKKEAAPAKPVLPKPVLVVKPADKARPDAAASSADPKQDATKPVAPATEPKPASPTASASAGPAAEPKSAVPTPAPPSAVATTTALKSAAPAPATQVPDTSPVEAIKPSVATTPAALPATASATAASANLAAPQPTIAKISDPGRPAPTGLARWLGIFKPYKINIQQGNFVSQDMAAKVRIGMTKEQVRFVLGTPLLTDMFHANRWDYLFRLQKPNGELTANRIAIFFRDNRIERIESSELPSESEYLTHIAGPATPAKPAAAPAAKPASSTPEPATKP